MDLQQSERWDIASRSPAMFLLRIAIRASDFYPVRRPSVVPTPSFNGLLLLWKQLFNAYRVEWLLWVEAVWKRETQSCRGIDSVLHRRCNSKGHECWRNFSASLRNADNLYGEFSALHAPTSLMAFMVFANPSIAITRLRLYASTCRLISVLTLANRRVRKCV